MSEHLFGIKLGQAQDYVEYYDPGLLVAIPRASSRQAINAEFYGVDLWTAYELSWLSPGGRPEVAIGEFSIPAHSPNLIESKSFKYYLNSFNQTCMDSTGDLQRTLAQDLECVAGSPVEVRLRGLEDHLRNKIVQPFDAVLLDSLPLLNPQYSPAQDLLRLVEHTFSGVWCSHLLK